MTSENIHVRSITHPLLFPQGHCRSCRWSLAVGFQNKSKLWHMWRFGNRPSGRRECKHRPSILPAWSESSITMVEVSFRLEWHRNRSAAHSQCAVFRTWWGRHVVDAAAASRAVLTRRLHWLHGRSQWHHTARHTLRAYATGYVQHSGVDCSSRKCWAYRRNPHTDPP